MTTKINADAEPNCEWKILYRVGGIAAFVAAILFRRNLAEEYLLFRGLGIIRSGPNSFPDKSGRLVHAPSHPSGDRSHISESAAAPFLLIWYLLLGRRLLQIG